MLAGRQRALARALQHLPLAEYIWNRSLAGSAKPFADEGADSSALKGLGVANQDSQESQENR